MTRRIPMGIGGLRYATIVADPPWKYEYASLYPGEPTKTKPMPYPMMSVQEIRDLPISNLAATAAHLYLWTTQRYLRDAYDVVDAWGFGSPSSVLVWVKPPRGFVGTYACSTEFVLFARRGSLAAKQKISRNWWEWKRRQHSAKPEAFLDIVESVSPGPYIELFARRNRLGWDTWGDEALKHVEVAA